MCNHHIIGTGEPGMARGNSNAIKCGKGLIHALAVGPTVKPCLCNPTPCASDVQGLHGGLLTMIKRQAY